MIQRNIQVTKMQDDDDDDGSYWIYFIFKSQSKSILYTNPKRIL